MLPSWTLCTTETQIHILSHVCKLLKYYIVVQKCQWVLKGIWSQTISGYCSNRSTWNKSLLFILLLSQRHYWNCLYLLLRRFNKITSKSSLTFRGLTVILEYMRYFRFESSPLPSKSGNANIISSTFHLMSSNLDHNL